MHADQLDVPVGTVGDRYAARLPVQPDDVGSVRRRLRAEAEAAAELAGHTTSDATS